MRLPRTRSLSSLNLTCTHLLPSSLSPHAPHALTTQLITPFHLYFNPRLIASPSGWEPWRLLTPFLYYGPLGLDWLFHMFFLVKYASALESGSFRGRSADFAWMLGVCGVALLAAAPVARAQFLGAPLAFALVYVWARRHPALLMSFLGVLTFTAPWLPWVLLGVSVLLRGSATVDLLGMAVGACLGDGRWEEREAWGGGQRGHDLEHPWPRPLAFFFSISSSFLFSLQS